MCKQQHLAQGCGWAMAFLEQHCSRVSSEKGHQGVKGLPDAVWADIKTDQMCVGGGGWGKGGRQRRSGRRGWRRLRGRGGVLKVKRGFEWEGRVTVDDGGDGGGSAARMVHGSARGCSCSHQAYLHGYLSSALHLHLTRVQPRG